MWVADSVDLSQMLGVDTGHDASPLTPIAAHRFHRLHDPQVSPFQGHQARLKVVLGHPQPWDPREGAALEPEVHGALRLLVIAPEVVLWNGCSPRPQVGRGAADAGLCGEGSAWMVPLVSIEGI